MIVHCTNCTERDNTELPDAYQGTVARSMRKILLCPRCRCPEVMLENKNYTKWLKEGNEPLNFKKNKEK